MSEYYQVPCSMTEPVETILNRRVAELKRKYPRCRQKGRISRARFLLAAAMVLVTQDDEFVLEMLKMAGKNMKKCREAK